MVLIRLTFEDSKKRETLNEKVLKNKLLLGEEFKKKSRNFFIMTDGGQPIYSRYGVPYNFSPFFATCYTIVSKFSVPLGSSENFQ